ncbi:MAG: SDR family oxidoreductase [Actinobacteria bacterium]|nr:SDR family oxidoreductase [Actinomycetota bacterium]
MSATSGTERGGAPASSWSPGAAVSIYAPDLFRGRVAVVTGAGTGLGREVALSFAHLGADLVVAGRTQGLLEGVADLVGEIGRGCVVVPTNIRDPAGVDNLRDEAYGQFGRVDFLVNNAGGQFLSPPSKITDNGWRSVVDLNLNGTWNMVSRFMGPMAEAGSGSIVNVIHIYSFERGAPMFVHSGAARAGVVNMTKTLAPYLIDHGVTINALAPGFFITPGMLESELEPVGRDEERFVDELREHGTSSRLGTVDEMAAAVVYLCSPAATYVSGTTMVVDGAASQSNWPPLFADGEF